MQSVGTVARDSLHIDLALWALLYPGSIWPAIGRVSISSAQVQRRAILILRVSSAATIMPQYVLFFSRRPAPADNIVSLVGVNRLHERRSADISEVNLDLVSRP